MSAKAASPKPKSSPQKARKSAPTSAETGRRLDPAYWLFKTEPETFSWETQKARGKKGEPWDGVRNFLARNNMKAMQLGDLGFFYHSGKDKEVVGVVEVCALAHPDPKDDTGVWKCVDVRAVCEMPKAVTLADVKANPRLANMALVKSARLSVQPVTPEEWKEVCRMGGLTAKDLAER